MEINFNRIYIGFFILIISLTSYFLNLDIVFLYIITFFSFFELYLSHFITRSVFFIFFLLFVLIKFFLPFDNFYIYTFYFIHLFFLSLIFFKINIRTSFAVLIFIFYLFFFALQNLDRELFYLIIFISFFNDTVAYISGNIFKGKKISPTISPSKTWSGTLFSTLLTFLIFLIFLNYNFILSILFSICFFYGDLFFSFIKRKFKLKDFSFFLSSHGGFLDRVDSMFFITPLILISFII